MITPDQLITAARNLIGVPWRHQGRTRHGLDCIGLVQMAARNAGLDLERDCGIHIPSVYSRAPDSKLHALVSQYCRAIEKPVPAALLLFQFDNDRYPRHFGLMSERDTVIHAECRVRGQVVEHGLRAHWVRWLHSAWLIPGVTYE